MDNARWIDVRFERIEKLVMGFMEVEKAGSVIT